jgi:hypothetical protein
LFIRAAPALYDEVYCARGEKQNRMKEQHLGLFDDRTSCHGWLRQSQASPSGHSLLQNLVSSGAARRRCFAWELRIPDAKTDTKRVINGMLGQILKGGKVRLMVNASKK